MNYNVQPFRFHPDVLESFGYAFDEFLLLLYCSAFPHLNYHNGHDAHHIKSQIGINTYGFGEQPENMPIHA